MLVHPGSRTFDVQCRPTAFLDELHVYALHSVSGVNLLIAFSASWGAGAFGHWRRPSAATCRPGRASIDFTIVGTGRTAGRPPSSFFIARFLYSIDYSFGEAEAAVPANARAQFEAVIVGVCPV